MKRARLLVASLLGLLVSCAPTQPPFTSLAAVSAPEDPSTATVVFLWPSTSCDVGGYYTLAMDDGRFLGNIASGQRLGVALAPGEHTLLGWSESRGTGEGAVATIPVMHATLVAGRTYYVRLAFGEWDDKGPRQMHARRSGQRLCFRIGDVMSTALVALTPQSEEWAELPGWTRELQAVAADSAAGQAWLDASHDGVAKRLELAKGRFDTLRPRGKRQATLVGDDGVVPAP